jgi:hypothetical protein
LTSCFHHNGPVFPTRPAGFKPATYGLEILSHVKSSAEETSTYKTTKGKLTPQLTPKSEKHSQVDTRNMPGDLAEIVAVWSELPDAIRSAIVAIVRASKGE